MPHLLRLEHGYQIPKLKTLCSYLSSSEIARGHVFSVCRRPPLPVDQTEQILFLKTEYFVGFLKWLRLFILLC